MQVSIIGWDIGGAHIKAAILEPNGVFSRVLQKPCPLWKGIEYLSQAVRQILLEIPDKKYIHALTMTGELVDLFDSRNQGVEQILASMQSCLRTQELLIYSGLDGLLPVAEIKQEHYKNIASTNWLASASLVAKKLKNGIFIDIGSTTSDILVLSDKQVQAIGMTDYERLVSEELVYTGIVRTAVMAVTSFVYFKGQGMGLMAEYFATMADIYRLTGELKECHDQTETADGAEKTILASAKRLSRMTGYEFSDKDLPQWQQLALYIKAQQKNKIRLACEKQLSRNLLGKKDFIIGAGIGRFLARQIARDLAYPYLDFTELFEKKCDGAEMDVADCAPAVSVALLALEGGSM